MAGRLHPHKLPIVALSVKGGVDQHPPLTKGGFDIKWNFNVGRVHIRIFEDNGVEFESKRSLYFNVSYVASVMLDGDETEASLLDRVAEKPESSIDEWFALNF